jgi:hypothetical protein
MKKILFIVLSILLVSASHAQTNDNHLMLSLGALYERGFDATIAFEHGTKYHNAWEYFATGYIQYADDPEAGHITKKSFWHNYRSWHLGIAYKPCVARGRNHHGNLRIGGSGGSDTNDFVGGVHVGYEHSYALKNGWELFFQVKEDAIIGRGVMWRTGASLGFKVNL